MSEGNCGEDKENIEEDQESAVDRPKQRGSYITSYQKHRLLQFVETHYDALFERSSASDNTAKDNLWKLLTIQLNCKGPNKNESGWRRCFISYKAATRCKLKSIEAGRNTVDKLNVADLRIAKMCKMDTYGVDLDAMLSKAGNDNSERVVSMANDFSAQHDQQSNSLMSTVVSLNLPLISENDYEEAIQSSRFAVNLDGNASVEGPRVSGNVSTHLVDMVTSSQSVQLVSRTNQTTDTAQIVEGPTVRHFNIGDIVTGFTPEYTNEIVFENLEGNISAVSHNRKLDRSHATEVQKDKLVQLVKENYSALFGRISNKINADLLKAKIWKQIMLTLNSIGPKKDIPSWKRCLSSLKDITKKKLTVARNHPRSNVHGKIATVVSPRDQELIEMFGIDILDGCGQLKEIGYKSPSECKNKNLSYSDVLEKDDVEGEANYMIQPQSSCTNSTVTSEMTSGHLPSNIQNTQHLDPPQQIHSRQLTNSAVILPSVFGTDSQSTQEPFAQLNQTRSFQMTQPRYHFNNATVTIDQLKTVANNMRAPVPSTTTNVATPSNSDANPIADSRKNTSQCNDKRNKSVSNGSKLHKSNKNQLQNGNVSPIRPLEEQRRQRRGVEVHPRRFVRPRIASSSSQTANNGNEDTSSDDNEEVSNRRRFRLSKPLGVFAEESLSLQKENNSLLRAMLAEMRKQK